MPRRKLCIMEARHLYRFQQYAQCIMNGSNIDTETEVVTMRLTSPTSLGMECRQAAKLRMYSLFEFSKGRPDYTITQLRQVLSVSYSERRIDAHLFHNFTDSVNAYNYFL